MYYKVTNASMSYGSDVILDSVYFEIHDKEKIALVGRNGCGKTTFLKGIMGELPFEEGTGEEKLSVIKQDNPTFGYLKQIVFSSLDVTLKEEIDNLFVDIFSIEKEMNKALDKMEKDPSEENINKYSSLFDKFTLIGGFTLQKDIKTILDGMGFHNGEENRKLSSFSGGEKTRIALIKLLLSKPDILLLDEPTNNLDIDTILWLENYLKNYPKSLVIVSHDRMFLDHVVDTVYEIEWGESHRYKGNYSHFVEQKKQEYLKREKDHNAQKKELERLNHIVERFLYKPTKSKLAKSVRKKIEKTEIINPPNPYDNKTFKTQCNPAHRSSEKVLVASELKIGFEKEILQTINLTLIRQRKLGIIGPNGTGKTTFIKTLLKQIPSLGGKIFFGENVEYGYFDQSMTDLDENTSIYDAFAYEFPDYTPQEIRNALGSFKISGDDVFKSVKELSGGEKVRFVLCKILKSRPNLLILDEPSNHVDIIGKETLESILKEYQGTIILISHDRYLINSICDSLLVFEKNKNTYYDFGYDEYLEKIKHIEIVKKETLKEEKKKSGPILEPKKINYTKQIVAVEEEIEKLNQEIDNLKEMFNDDSITSSFEKMNEIDKNITILESKVEELEDKWQELNLLSEEQEKK